ncbi:hypothetical protein [Streptomyces mirabilis]|uniref:hypothetical protein n=1 Tax=Streptomyces mirabilis TaxID=68239 RepID=UPI00381E48BD
MPASITVSGVSAYPSSTSQDGALDDRPVASTTRSTHRADRARGLLLAAQPYSGAPPFLPHEAFRTVPDKDRHIRVAKDPLADDELHQSTAGADHRKAGLEARAPAQRVTHRDVRSGVQRRSTVRAQFLGEAREQQIAQVQSLAEQAVDVDSLGDLGAVTGGAGEVVGLDQGDRVEVSGGDERAEQAGDPPAQDHRVRVAIAFSSPTAKFHDRSIQVIRVPSCVAAPVLRCGTFRFTGDLSGSMPVPVAGTGGGHALTRCLRRSRKWRAAHLRLPKASRVPEFRAGVMGRESVTTARQSSNSLIPLSAVGPLPPETLMRRRRHTIAEFHGMDSL